jgi:catechol 2,3-dioxygenase-like lactoylglutathione lyase family enzyme
MDPITVDHMIIAVSDWDVSNAFYRDVVGAEVLPHPDGHSTYRFGNQQLNVHGPGVAAEPVARLPVKPGGSDLCFHWPGDVESAIAHLGEHRVEVEYGPIERSGFGGTGTSVYFRDPDGSLLEFLCFG